MKNTSVDPKITAFALGALPVLFLGIYILIKRSSLILELDQLVLLVFTGLCLSFVGNKFSVLAMQNAPNPGYSLVIQKSYAPYTTVAALLLFQSPVSFSDVLGIGVVIFGLFLILVDRSSARGLLGKWMIQSLYCFLAFGTLNLISKLLLTDGLQPEVITFYIFLFAGFAFIIDTFQSLRDSIKSKWTIRIISLLMLIGILNTGFNLFLQSAIKTAPNVGLVNIINASSNAMTALLAALIFKDTLTRRKLVGVVITIVGLSFIFI